MEYLASSGRTSLKVHTGAQCGKISVKVLCRASHLAHPAVYCGVTCNCDCWFQFLAAIATAGFLHCAEQLPVA